MNETKESKKVSVFIIQSTDFNGIESTMAEWVGDRELLDTFIIEEAVKLLAYYSKKERQK